MKIRRSHNRLPIRMEIYFNAWKDGVHVGKDPGVCST